MKTGCYSKWCRRGWPAQPRDDERLGVLVRRVIEGAAPEISGSNTRLQPCARTRETLILKSPVGLVIRWLGSGKQTGFRLPGWLRGCKTASRPPSAKAGRRGMIAVDAEAKNEFPILALIIDALSRKLKCSINSGRVNQTGGSSQLGEGFWPAPTIGRQYTGTEQISESRQGMFRPLHSKDCRSESRSLNA